MPDHDPITSLQRELHEAMRDATTAAGDYLKRSNLLNWQRFKAAEARHREAQHALNSAVAAA